MLKEKWLQNFLSSHLKETSKQYIEVYYRIFISALSGEYFDLKSLVVCHLGYLGICTLRHNWDHAILFLMTQWLICSHNRMYGKCFRFQHRLRRFQNNI